MAKIEEKVAEQSRILNKLSNKVIKVNKERVTVYTVKKGKVKYARSWVPRKKYSALIRDKAGIVLSRTYRNQRLPEGFKKVKLKGKVLELRNVKVRVRKTRTIKDYKVFVYTKTQAKYVKSLIKRNQLLVPARKRTMQRVVANLLNPLRRIGISSRFLRPTPK